MRKSSKGNRTCKVLEGREHGCSMTGWGAKTKMRRDHALEVHPLSQSKTFRLLINREGSQYSVRCILESLPC